MKKFFLAALLFCFCFTQVNALYFGNILEPEIIDQGMVLSKDNWMGLKVGYQGDFVFDRKLRTKDGCSGRIDEFQIFLQQGLIALDFADRAQFYGTVGAANLYFTHRPDSDQKRREYQNGADFTWGVGARGVLASWGNTSLGIDAAIQYANMVTKWETIDGVSYSNKVNVNYMEWQGGLAVAHKIDILIPYFAVKYSSVQGKVKNLPPALLIPPSESNHFELRERTCVGCAIGATVSMGTIFDANVEISFIDEEALFVAANLKF